MDLGMKKYVVLTLFGYAEPGHSSTHIVPFETVCDRTALANAYRAWLKTHIAAEGPNERHFGYKKVLNIYEAVSIPSEQLAGCFQTAMAEVVAGEEAHEQAELERQRLEDAQQQSSEEREREEYLRLARKFGRYPHGFV